MANVLYFARLKGVYGKQWNSRAEWLLTELGLWERRSDRVGSLSRGMQQKVAVVCALVADPPVLLLDEPTLGLDAQAARTVRQWVTKLCAEYGKTVVLTTHQLDMAQELCSRVAIIKDGTLLANRPVKGLLELSAVESYEVRVKGRLDPALELPGHVNISNSGDGDETVITGIGADQEKLHEVLRWVHGLNLPVLSVDRGAPDLEDVYLRLIEEGK